MARVRRSMVWGGWVLWLQLGWTKNEICNHNRKYISDFLAGWLAGWLAVLRPSVRKNPPLKPTAKIKSKFVIFQPALRMDRLSAGIINLMAGISMFLDFEVYSNV